MLPGLALMLLAAGLALWAWLGQRRAGRSHLWPFTEGRVESCEIERVVGGNEGDEFLLRIRYAYRAGGQDHTGTRHSWAGNPRSMRRAEIEAIAAPLAAGSPVRVYYNPARPADSVLDPEGTMAITRNYRYALLAAGVGLILMLLENALLRDP